MRTFPSPLNILTTLLPLLFLPTFLHAAQFPNTTKQVSAYWGFGNERPLSAYCAPDSGIDILILGSITPLKSGGHPTGIFGHNCTVNTDGSFTKGCADVARDIGVCQEAGVKIFVGFSSYGHHWAISSHASAKHIASSLWKSYGGLENTTTTTTTTTTPNTKTNHKAKRPFGNVVVDGFDFDVENNPEESKKHLGSLVTELRSKFAEDPSRRYYISGAPQCGIPDPNMGVSMMEAVYDYLWIQFYNNDCAAADLFKPRAKNPNGKATYNLASWPSYLSAGASANATLFLGLPASPDAAVPYDFVQEGDLLELLKQSPQAGGVMLWDTAHSDQSVQGGCTYAQNIASIIATGDVCAKFSGGS